MTTRPTIEQIAGVIEQQYLDDNMGPYTIAQAVAALYTPDVEWLESQLAQRWLPVSELPEIDKPVLGKTSMGKYPIPVSLAYAKDGQSFWRVWPMMQFLPDTVYGEVTHWMPLPAAPITTTPEKGE